ncbi:MAG TPA: lipid-A-disaccharide synthase [Terriglobales bacterium]|nr:lipid-A-disaccharide synthase [Terriglobales bacterium]
MTNSAVSDHAAAPTNRKTTALRRILICAGEASGENYGAQFIAALRLLRPELEFFGVGGDRMREAGCETVVDARELAVVGITEILSHLPRIYGEFRKLIYETDQRRPDAAVLIDSPAFNLKVARELHRRNIPVIYYVAPQFWAWRQGRVRYIRRYFRKTLVIFPFEEKFYRSHGVDAEFVGHPLANVPRPAISREDFARQYGLDVSKTWIALLPGSRVKEVRMNLPTIAQAALRMGGGYEFLLPVAPTLDRNFVEGMIAQSKAPIHLTSGSLATLAVSRAAVVASGTATVEAAAMDTPFVMVYRVTPSSWALGRRMLKVNRFAMVNLLADEEVVPELVQSHFTVENVVAELEKILPDGPARSKMLAGLARVRATLRAGNVGDKPPAQRAAEATLAALQ